jgi:hypothetical protein
VKDLCDENDKALMKEFEEDTHKKELSMFVNRQN